MPHALSSLDVMFRCRNLDKQIYLFQAKNLLQAETHFQPLHLLESHHGSPIIVNIGSKCHGVQMKEFFTHTQRCMHIESDISQPSNQPSYNKNSCPTHISTIFVAPALFNLFHPKNVGFLFTQHLQNKNNNKQKHPKNLVQKGDSLPEIPKIPPSSFVGVFDFVSQDVWGCPKQKKTCCHFHTIPFLQKKSRKSPRMISWGHIVIQWKPLVPGPSLPPWPLVLLVTFVWNR